MPRSEFYGVTSKETAIKITFGMDRCGQDAKKARKLERETKEVIKQNTG
jgi:hypothetical protein